MIIIVLIIIVIIIVVIIIIIIINPKASKISQENLFYSVLLRLLTEETGKWTPTADVRIDNTADHSREQ